MKKLIPVILAFSGIMLLMNFKASASSEAAISGNRAIEKRFIPKLNQSVTFMGLGGVELGRDWGIDKNNRKLPSEETAKKILDTAMDNHISVIDTAASYQLSEERIGQYVPPNKYHYLLVTKAGEHSLLGSDPECQQPSSKSIYCDKPRSAYDFSKKAIYNDVEQSLKKLHVRQLDIVLLHFEDNESANNVLDKGEAVAALKSLQREGKIRFIGASINGKIATRCIESNNFDVIELEYNLLNQTNAKNIELAHAKGMGVIVRGGLGTGLLTSQVQPYLKVKDFPYRQQVKALLKLTKGNFDTLTQLSLAFLYQNKDISSVIIGVSSPQQMLKNIRFLNTFHRQQLLSQAEKLMKTFTPPPGYTADMGEYEESA